MAELLTAKQLAEKAGISPAELRKLLSKEFNRAGKTKVEGNRMEYRFASNDPTVKQIVEKAKTPAAEKPEAKRAIFCLWQRSSVVEQRTYKPLVVGSNPSAASSFCA